MMKKLSVCFLILLLALTLAACGKAENAKGITLAADELNEVNIGDTLRIVVKENHTTQYRWYFDVSGDDILEVASDNWSLDSKFSDRGGEGGTRTIIFLTISSGEAMVRMALMPEMLDMSEPFDFDEDVAGEQKVIYSITVK